MLLLVGVFLLRFRVRLKFSLVVLSRVIWVLFRVVLPVQVFRWF